MQKELETDMTNWFPLYRLVPHLPAGLAVVGRGRDPIYGWSFE
jgi:hypothetical protein